MKKYFSPVTIVLLKWAFHLTKSNTDLAKDLVQEAFVQFTVSGGDLVDINNIDNYLFGVVRTTHLSYLRQTSRQQHEPIAGDFDSSPASPRPVHQVGL